MVVAITEKSLSSGLVRQWRQYIHEETRPPSLELFYSFLDRQRKSAPDHRLSSLKPSKPKGAVPNKRAVLNMQESRCSLDQHRDKCPFCELTHGIFSCTELRDLSVTARLDQVRQRKLCFYCLGKEHSVNQCPRKKRCKRCKVKHQTLLH